MKKLLPLTLLVTLPLIMPFAWADEDHHTDKDKNAATTMTDKDKQMQMGKMQENMLKMHDQMHKIIDANNSNERERLTQEFSKMMQDKVMGDHGAMGGDTKGG